ncbi:hypothetical protein ACKAV7_001905 [Fusarium commune]
MPCDANRPSYLATGDLNTFTLDLGKDLGAPSSKPILEDVMQLGSGPALTEMTVFQFLQSHQFHYSNPFIQLSLPQQNAVLLTLVSPDPFDETMDQHDAPMDLNASEGRKSSISDALSKSMSTVGFWTSQVPAGQLARQLRPFPERFRLHCTLNAPTAMIKHADENPATYLNKGYTYYLCVADTSAMELPVQETINQAFTPGINGPPAVNVAIRFHVLSTDFSHLKGVYGIPVRFSAKTSLIPYDTSRPGPELNAEICFCKIKLFRDHGAERKLPSDVMHMKKPIDKLK